jgi:hypothetical protein
MQTINFKHYIYIHFKQIGADPDFIVSCLEHAGFV